MSRSFRPHFAARNVRGPQDVELPRNIAREHKPQKCNATANRNLVFLASISQLSRQCDMDFASCRTCTHVRTSPREPRWSSGTRRSPLTFAEDVPMSPGRVTLESCVRRGTCSRAIGLARGGRLPLDKRPGERRKERRARSLSTCVTAVADRGDSISSQCC